MLSAASVLLCPTDLKGPNGAPRYAAPSRPGVSIKVPSEILFAPEDNEEQIDMGIQQLI